MSIVNELAKIRALADSIKIQLSWPANSMISCVDRFIALSELTEGQKTQRLEAIWQCADRIVEILSD